MQTIERRIRLQKFMAQSGVCSRRKAETYILEGKVRVNNTVMTTPGIKIDPINDIVIFDKKKVKLSPGTENIYIALNKPEGYISSCSRKHGKIILDLVKVEKRIFPVGRLDKNSKGLILLTNDGALHHKLSHPSFNHEKEYIVKTRQPISDNALNRMTSGMIIDKVALRRACVSRIDANSFMIVLKQGINRQIRKMVRQTGNQVDSLLRTRIADIKLGQLKQGCWRCLSAKEVKSLSQ